jgi:hypothetical protein
VQTAPLGFVVSLGSRALNDMRDVLSVRTGRNVQPIDSARKLLRVGVSIGR